MTNPWPHIKNAIRYEWCDVLLDRLYSTEHCADLPLNDIHQDIARRITFGWGFSIALGINTLLWVFLIMPRTPDLLSIAIAAGMILLSLLGGALIGAAYLAIQLIRIAARAAESAKSEQSAESAKKSPSEGESGEESHENG